MRAVSAREMSGKIGGLLREQSPGATSSEEPRCDQQSVTEKCAANGARHGPDNAAPTIERIVRNLTEWTGHGRGSDHWWRTDDVRFPEGPPAFRTLSPDRIPTDIGRTRRTPRQIAGSDGPHRPLGRGIEPAACSAGFVHESTLRDATVPNRICITNVCRASIFDQGERDGGRQRLEQTTGCGDSERGLLHPSAGTVRPDVSANAGVSWLHDHRQDQAGHRG